VPNVVIDLAFTRRVLKLVHEQKIAFKTLVKMFTGMGSTSSMSESSSVKDVRLLTISKVMDVPSWV